MEYFMQKGHPIQYEALLVMFFILVSKINI